MGDGNWATRIADPVANSIFGRGNLNNFAMLASVGANSSWCSEDRKTWLGPIKEAVPT